jgi:hypothetical protein
MQKMIKLVLDDSMKPMIFWLLKAGKAEAARDRPAHYSEIIQIDIQNCSSIFSVILPFCKSAIP